MRTEILRILNMLKEEKIDVEKAADIIEALKMKENLENISVPVDSNLQNKMIRIKMISEDGDKANISVPTNCINSIEKTLCNFPVIDSMEGFDFNLIQVALESGAEGKIIDMESEDGDLLEVVIE